MRYSFYKYILSALVFFSITVICRGNTKESQNDSYQIVWQDNFDTGILNENHWMIEVMGDGGNDELQYYRAENVSLGTEPATGKKCLIITAKKENYAGHHFTSARVISQDRVNFKYGKLEAGIKPPETANGLWPAFWILGANYPETGWPSCGEIDIIEMGHTVGIAAGMQEYYFNGACHWGPPYNEGFPVSYANTSENTYPVQDDFHLYTMIWDEKSIKMYLDQDKYPDTEPYFEMGIDDTENPYSPGHYFHHSFFIILNMAVGGHFTGIVGNNNTDLVTALNESNNYEAHMYVDFVRLYQKGNENEYYSAPVPETGVLETTLYSRYYLLPNPAQNKIQIEGPDMPVKITFSMLSGQEILIFQNTYVCEISSLPVGNYLIKIEDNKGHFETHQLIKK